MRTFLIKLLRTKLFTLIILLAAIVLFFSIYSNGTFFQLQNVIKILNVMVIVALLTIGASCLIISGKLDLSTGAVGTMSGILMALLLQNGLPWPLAMLIALLLGAFAGVFNGILVNELNFQPFIATLATASIAQGLTYVLSSAKAVPISNSAVEYIGSGKLGSYVPVSIFIALIGLVVYGFILNKTRFGRNIYMVGGNPHAAMLSGINPKRMSYILFINSGAFGALAGCILAARLKSATVTGIVSSQFSGVTAAILGGISFGGGSGGMGGAFVGLLILNSFNNGMTIIQINPYWQTVASGVLLLFALTLDYLKTQSMTKNLGV